MKELISQFDWVINQATIEQKNKNSYGYLPDITLRLIELRDSLSNGKYPDKETRIKLIGHVGYIILDNMQFAESPLGEKIIDLINEYRDLD